MKGIPMGGQRSIEGRKKRVNCIQKGILNNGGKKKRKIQLEKYIDWGNDLT